MFFKSIKVADIIGFLINGHCQLLPWFPNRLLKKSWFDSAYQSNHFPRWDWLSGTCCVAPFWTTRGRRNVFSGKREKSVNKNPIVFLTTWTISHECMRLISTAPIWEHEKMARKMTWQKAKRDILWVLITIYFCSGTINVCIV